MPQGDNLENSLDVPFDVKSPGKVASIWHEKTVGELDLGRVNGNK